MVLDRKQYSLLQTELLTGYCTQGWNLHVMGFSESTLCMNVDRRRNPTVFSVSAQHWLYGSKISSSVHDWSQEILAGPQLGQFCL